MRESFAFGRGPREILQTHSHLCVCGRQGISNEKARKLGLRYNTRGRDGAGIEYRGFIYVSDDNIHDTRCLCLLDARAIYQSGSDRGCVVKFARLGIEGLARFEFCLLLGRYITWSWFLIYHCEPIATTWAWRVTISASAVVARRRSRIPVAWAFCHGVFNIVIRVVEAMMWCRGEIRAKPSNDAFVNASDVQI
jgi:hypothetical protein